MTEESNHYGHTAARKQGRPGRETRPPSVTVDMHSHVMVPKAAELVAPHLDWSTIPLAHFATPATQALNRKQDADRRAEHDRPRRRGCATWTRPASTCRSSCRRRRNATTRSTARSRPRRARWSTTASATGAASSPTASPGSARVPMQDPEAAVAELRAAAWRELGLKGVQILTNVAGRELSDPDVRTVLGRRPRRSARWC